MGESGPTINRHNSEQDVQTPPELIVAVELKFGKLQVDLAASPENAQARGYLTEADDALSVLRPWHKYGLSWLNPPYSNITPWAKKCAQEWVMGAEVLLLVPASIGANWYWDWVEPFATVYSIGRVKFVGHKTPYPKDLILAHYSRMPRRSMQRWRWQFEQQRHNERKIASSLDSGVATAV